MISDGSNFSTTSCSIDRIANPISLSCVMVDLEKVFISFSLENSLSPDATVTGRVKSIRSAVVSDGSIVAN